MSRRLVHTAATAAAVLLMLVMAIPAAAQETQDTTLLPEALRSARSAVEAAYAKLDGAAVGAQFADDGVVDYVGQPITGRQAVTGWFVQMFAELSSLRSGTATFVIGETEVTERSTYVAVVSEGEAPGTSETVWKRQEDGSWRIARLTVL